MRNIQYQSCNQFIASEHLGEPKDMLTRKFVNAGIRVEEMKLLLGNPGKPDGWIPPPQVIDSSEHEFEKLFKGYISPDSVCTEVQTRLFNLTEDPFEKNNLAQDMPKMVQVLSNRLEKYFASMIPPDNAPEIIDGNPNRNGGFLSPGWCRAEP